MDSPETSPTTTLDESIRQLTVVDGISSNSSTCTMCRIINHIRSTERHRLIYQDRVCAVLLDQYPEQSGHTLVIPRIHVPTFWDLDNTIQQHLLIICKKIELAIREVTNPDRVALMVTGLQIPEHMHIHLRPVSQEEAARKKLDHKTPTEASRKDLTSLAVDIRACLKPRHKVRFRAYERKPLQGPNRVA